MNRHNQICVVGAGNWGKNHIRTLNDLKLLGGIVDYNQDSLSYFAEKYPNILIYNNLDDALMNDDFRGFTVATPANTHYEIAKKIITSGKHVLVEKPLTLDIRDAENLVKLATNYCVNLMVGHLLLFHPAIIKIKELIKNGSIGELQYIYSNRLNLGQVRTEENVFWSLAPHDISIFQYLSESYPHKIIANASTLIQDGIHDSTITQLKYPNGIEGHIFVSWIHPFKEHRVVVVGSGAMISFEDSNKNNNLKLYSKKIDLQDGIPKKVDGPVEIIKYENRMPLTEELKYFSERLNGLEIEIANSHHGLEVIKILVEASKQLDKNE